MRSARLFHNLNVIVLAFVFGTLINSSIRAQTMIEIRPDWNSTMDNKMEWWRAS